jgi:hypothetical protein
MSLPVWPSGLHPLRGGDVLGIGNPARTSELGAAGAGGLTLQRCSFPDQLTSVLGRRSEDANHHSSSGGAGVDAIRNRLQRDTPVRERLYLRQ